MSDEQQEQPEHLDQIRDIIFGPQKREFENRIKELEARIDDARAQIAVLIDSLNATLMRELQTLSEHVERRFSAVDSSVEATVRGLDAQLQILESKTSHERSELEKQFTESIISTNKNVSERWSTLDTNIVRLAQSTAADRDRLLDQLASNGKRFEVSIQSVVQIAKENIAAVGEQVRILEQSKNADRDELAKSLENAQHRLDKAIQYAIQSAAERTAAVDAAMRAENLRMQQDLTALRDHWTRELETRTNELDETKVSREMMAEALIELGMKVKAGERLSELKLLTKKPTQ